ncbi:hypothetical protein [Herbidospora daliensis]|uniref:hypothetical protein n=1 Tax=Herbidospora daliensis TaxID=295585 RepID=UPI0007821ABC|nr:hypothetical protein [Herbidospora daliensis]
MPIPRISVGDGAPAGARDALHRLVASSEGESRWARLPDRIVVDGVLTGGRGGADVFEITAYWDEGHWRYVAKLGPAEELAREWGAYRKYFAGKSNVLCAPVELATPAVLDETKRIRGQRELIVYGHVTSFSGSPDQSLATLEDLARQGCHDTVDRLIDVIARFARSAGSVLYGGAKPQPGPDSLRSQAGTLGCMLTLDPDDGDGPLVDSDTLLAACLSLPTEAGLGRVRLPLTLIPGRDGLWGEYYGLKIKVAADAAPVPGEVAEITGKVAETFAGASWSLMSRLCPDLRREGAHLFWGREQTDLPFGCLYEILTREEQGRVVALVHGDLNPRNIVVCADRPFLIDFDKTDAGQPLLSDYAWLETGLLRDVLAGRHGFGQMLLLQRLLGLACRALEATAPPGSARRAAAVEAALVEVIREVAPDLENSFRLLWAVRVQGCHVYPAQSGPAWWREYAAQLVIAVNRTFKWGDHGHTAAGMSAVVAAGGAASEMWRSDRVFERWQISVLTAAARALIPILDGRSRDAAEIAAELVTELDRRGVRDALVEQTLASFRDSLVKGVLGDQSAHPTSLGDRVEYVPLTAYPGGGHPPGQDALLLLRQDRHVVLLGQALAGKTTLLEEIRLRSMTPDIESDPSPAPAFLPLKVSAADLSAVGDLDGLRLAWTACGLPTDWAQELPALLAIGAVRLLVDHLDHLGVDGREGIFEWLRDLALDEGRRSSVVIACRIGAHADTSGSTSHIGPFSIHILAPPAPALVRPFLQRALASNGDTGRSLIDRFVDDHADGGEGIPRWPSPTLWSPAVLPLIHILAEEPDADPSVNALLGRYVGRLVETSRIDAHLRDRVLSAIAGELTRRRSERLPLTDLPAVSAADDVEDMVDDLVACGLLTRQAASVTFESSLIQDYFSARALARVNRSELLEGVRDFRWHVPILLLLNSLEGDDPAVSALVDEAMRYDEGLAVEFLRAARTPARALLPQLRADLRDRIALPGLRQDERVRAASALADLGGRGARQLLGSLVTDSSVSAPARVAALRGLERMMHRAPEPASGRVRTTLRQAIHAVLTSGTPPQVRHAALDLAGRAGLHHLLPRIAELVDPAQPWPTTDAAMTAFRALQADSTDAVRHRWTASCSDRLQGIESEIADAARHEEQVRLTGERRRLLAELACAPHHDLLLRYRFRFDLADDVADLLNDLETDSSQDVTPAWAVLTKPETEARLMNLIDQDDEPVAAAAAHRLLPVQATAIVMGAVPDGSPSRMLITAAAIADLDVVNASRALDHVEHVITEMAAHADPDRLESLAALVTGVFAIDRERGVRLTLHTARALEVRGIAGRQAWPWSMAFARTRGGITDLLSLLAGDDRAVELAIFGLAGLGFLIDARPGPGVRLDERGAGGFRAARPKPSGRQAWRYVMAAAAVGATEALPYACDLAVELSGNPTTAIISTSGYGHLEETDLAGVLAAVGYLGRISARGGNRSEADMARATLSAFPVARSHPSVAVGRLTGLAYLGEWRRVLEGCDLDDPRLAQIAANALQLWRNDTPADSETNVALSITTRLQATALPDSVRTVLSRLRRDAEHKAGLFTEPPPSDATPARSAMNDK